MIIKLINQFFTSVALDSVFEKPLWIDKTEMIITTKKKKKKIINVKYFDS